MEFGGSKLSLRASARFKGPQNHLPAAVLRKTTIYCCNSARSTFCYFRPKRSINAVLSETVDEVSTMVLKCFNTVLQAFMNNLCLDTYICPWPQSDHFWVFEKQNPVSNWLSILTVLYRTRSLALRSSVGRIRLMMSSQSCVLYLNGRKIRNCPETIRSDVSRLRNVCIVRISVLILHSRSRGIYSYFNALWDAASVTCVVWLSVASSTAL